MTDWRAVLGALASSSDLTAEQAHWAMSQIMTGEATAAQIGGFLVGLRAKGETSDEIGGLVAAVLANAHTVSTPLPAIDIVGTGGDGAHSVNVSTMAALTVAGAGVPVLKHGNRAISSKSGTADVLEALGVAIPLPPNLVATCLAEAGMAFCFAPAHHPGFRHAGPVRKELGIPTVFNVLGPLCNPGQPPAALIGCADLTMAPLLANVQRNRGLTAAIVRSDLGLDEITTAGTTQVWDVTTGEVRHEVLEPARLGLSEASVDDLRGDDAEHNAAVLRAVLGGSREGTVGKIRDVVIVNAAAALVVHDAMSGEQAYGSPQLSFVTRLEMALPIAADAIDSGAATAAIDRLVSVSRVLASSTE